jgi:hypothetical protein
MDEEHYPEARPSPPIHGPEAKGAGPNSSLDRSEMVPCNPGPPGVDLELWRAVSYVEPLAKAYRCILFDHRGQKKSAGRRLSCGSIGAQPGRDLACSQDPWPSRQREHPLR